MRVTPNNFINGTALANSDFVYFSGTPIIGSIRAYELRDTPTGTNKVTATVKGYIDSLHLSAFSDVSGGFFDPGIALAPTAVPEPPTYAMMLAGLGLIVFIRSRKKQNAI